jgi:AraC family transcriptional regulator
MTLDMKTGAGLRSRIPFRSAITAKPAAALHHARILNTSAGLGWQGLHVEIGENDGWDLDNLSICGHYVALNLNTVPLVIERRTPVGFRREAIAPGSLWVQPAGDPFTFRVAQTSRYAGVVLDSDRAKSLIGVDLALRPTFSLDDTDLIRLVRTAAAETQRGGMSGRLFADGVTVALAARLAWLQGTRATEARGGIAPQRLQRVFEFIDAHVGESLPLDVLAKLAGISVFHFARAFKQSTGVTPHRYVLDRRLDRARNTLASGNLTVTEAARRYGFADRAHLSRTFKQRFGVAPTEALAPRPGE